MDSLTGTRSLEQALAESPAGALVRRAADSQKVAVALAGAEISLPPSFDALQPGTCEVRGKTLVLFVGSPALAAKMRQSLPQLLAWLDRHGFELTEINLRLQPERMSYRALPGEETMKQGAVERAVDPAQTELSVSGALGLAEKLALTLPDTGVGRAAQYLASKLRRRIAQTG
jgi:hypothetical protein